MFEIEIKRIQEAYAELMKKDDYQNYARNRKLAQGKSKDVFRTDVIKRVKLEYMGVTDGNDIISYRYDRNGNKFYSEKSSIDSLIIGNNILQSISKKYAELASDKYPLIKIDNEEILKEIKNSIPLDTKTGEYVFTSSWNGDLLLKTVIVDNKVNIYDIKRKDFFEIYNIYNPQLVDGFVVFELLKEEKGSNIRVEVYTEGKTEYRLFKMGDEWEELQYDIDLSEVAFIEGKGYIKNYEGWQVGYVKCTSDYNLDIVSNVAEIVVQDTTTSQAFNKALNPIIQVPPSVLERDKDGNMTIHIEDRVVVVDERDKDIKQLEINTKMDQWNIQRNNLLNNIYTSTGVNKNILGFTLDGADYGSGVAVERSMQSILSIVNYKRNKVYKALETCLNWGYDQIGKNINLEITGDDILNKTKKEELEDEGIEIDNIGKLANVLVTLQNANTDEEIQKMVNDLGEGIKEKMRTLGLKYIREEE